MPRCQSCEVNGLPSKPGELGVGLQAKYQYGHNLDPAWCVYSDPNKVFMYGLTNRPPGFATVPHFKLDDKRCQYGQSWDGQSMPYGGSSTDAHGFRWGVVAYPQPLSPEDVYSYELKPIGRAASVAEAL